METNCGSECGSVERGTLNTHWDHGGQGVQLSQLPFLTAKEVLIINAALSFPHC